MLLLIGWGAMGKALVELSQHLFHDSRPVALRDAREDLAFAPIRLCCQVSATAGCSSFTYGVADEDGGLASGVVDHLH